MEQKHYEEERSGVGVKHKTGGSANAKRSKRDGMMFLR